MSFGKTTPILRIFDENKAVEFYVDFLGFKIDWQHRFEANFPLYLQVSRGECVLHLSEHHGDARRARRCESRPMSWRRFSSNCWPRNTRFRTRRFRPCRGAART